MEIGYTLFRETEEYTEGLNYEKRLGQPPRPSLTLRGRGLLYSKPSTNVFQLLDSKLYKVCANQLSKQ